MTLLEERPAESFRETPIPVLETERLTLRAPCLEDAKSIAALANDLRVAQNTTRMPHPYSIAEAEAWAAAANTRPGEASFVVTVGDRVIGGCGVATREARGQEPGLWLGYWYGVPYWGQGYATEAARAVIDHAFGDLGHEVLHSGARVSNPASRRVLEKCGFQWIGVGLYRIRSIASSAPVDRFRLDRGLWTSLKNWRAVKRAG